MAVLVHALERLPADIAANPKVGAVHRLRTTVRRMEALLSRVGGESGLAERKLLKQLARIRRCAGKVRDLDIQMKALDSLTRDAVAPEKARVRRALKKVHAKRRRQLVQVLEDENAPGLKKRLRRLAARAKETPRSRGERSGKARHDESAVLNVALDQFAGLVKAHGAMTDENLHDFRMETKRLRYLVETAGNTLRVRSAIDQFKRIQNAIGDWHDWLTLTHTAAKVLGAPAGSPLLVALRRTVRARFLKALRVTADAKEHLAELRRPLSARKPPRAVIPSRPPQKRTGAATLAELRPSIGSLPSPLATLHGDDYFRRS